MTFKNVAFCMNYPSSGITASPTYFKKYLPLPLHLADHSCIFSVICTSCGQSFNEIIFDDLKRTANICFFTIIIILWTMTAKLNIDH